MKKIGENKKERKILNKKTIGIGIAIILIAVITISILIQQNRQIQNISPELARAMTYEQFLDGEEEVEGTNGSVKFRAFFLRDINNDGEADRIKGTARPIGEEDTLYMEIIVQTAGYLKDAKIQINGQNFYFQTALPEDNELLESYIGNNIKEIQFKELGNGTQKLLTGVVRSGDYTYSSSIAEAIGKNINQYSREDNSIILTGTYVNGTQETPITKQIDLTVDWYGETEATLSTGTQNYYNLNERIDETNGKIDLDFTISTNETERKLNISKNHVKGTIPELNGYAPVEVTYTGTNATFQYNEETREFTIERTAQIDGTGNITQSVSTSNSYNIRVSYPLEAYQLIGEDIVNITIPVETYYEGYNNPNTEFTNPYKSNTATGNITAYYTNQQETVGGEERDPSFSITVGKQAYNPYSRYYISKQKPLRIYNGLSSNETSDTYQVRWYAYTGTNGESTGLVLKETKDGETQVSDRFIAGSTSESMEPVVSNIGIAFTGADNLLQEDGWINVYDDQTDELLVTFTKDNWNRYTSSNPYKYEIPVKHVRVETSSTNAESSMYIYHIKEIDDDLLTTNYEKAEFDTFEYIQSTLEAYMGGNHIQTATHQAHYEAPFSIANISLSKDTISTQITERNLKITITAESDAPNNQIGWTDGSFLIKLPQEILTAEINNVEISNNQVSLLSYELLEIEDNWFIKINTSNQNENPQSYKITIDVNLTPDPRIATINSAKVELYASNQEVGEYYYPGADTYDVNDNLNTEELVNKREANISLISPNSLLTNQTISNFDEKQSIIVSPEIADIKPLYVNVDNEKRQATIGAQFRNNYSSTISDIKILGKIPFEGNTYALSEGDLNSTYTTNMTNEGILIPEGLEGKVTIYYSENTNPDTDLTNTENGWKTKDQVTNWENIRTYFIDFEDTIINVGDEYIFYYTVELPNGLEFNEVSYSHHGITFSLDTDQGKYRTQTEPNKIGLRIAEKFDVETTKYQTGREKLVPGATYKISDVETGETKTGVTNAQGILNISGLYAEKTYEIQEIKSPTNYALNGEIIRFIGHVDENGTLTIEKTQGTTKEDIQVIKQEGEEYKVTVKVEDEVKASIKIIKKEAGTQNLIRGVRLKITGAGLPESGRNLTTNINGEITLNGLEIGQEYTLQETKAVEGYYIIENPIKFKIENQEGNYVLNIIEGNITNHTVEEIDSIPTINITLENEKIPTYNLNITKIKKETQVGTETGETIETEKLAGAKFKLYKEEKEIGEYTTDGNGNITITGLYQYIEEKPENATYTLKEVLAPVGYAKVKDITFQVDGTTGELIFKNQEGTEENYTTQGTTINLIIEDSPAFRLIKQDESGARIQDVKFAIYNVEEGVIPARNSKGEILGTKETINGKEYYTLTTDQNGEITADLAEGLYKAVEVQAPEQYDTSNKEYYFGIGASREAPTTFAPTWAQSIGGSSTDQITSVAGTSDGGYIVGGYFESSSITVGNGVNGNPVELTSAGNEDGMIIKYDKNGKVEWAQSIGGSSSDYINSVAETSDGGYIVGGDFHGNITVGNDVNGNPVKLTSIASSDGMIIKYDKNGAVEWAQSIGGGGRDYINSVSETSDGGYIVGGYFISSSITVGNDVNGNPVELINAGYDSYYQYNDGMIIKYDENGIVEWAQSIGGSDRDYINSVSETSDGGCIVGGYFGYDDITVGKDVNGNPVELTNAGSDDGMIIKYDENGIVEWAQSIGGSSSDYINSVAVTSDGGYIVGGYFYGNITVGNDVNGNPVNLTNAGTSWQDGMIIKYDANGAVEWAQSIGGSDSDYIESVAGTNDGGYIIGGYYSSRSIIVGNDVNGNPVELTKAGYSDGMIIKYDENGIVEWAQSIGGSYDDEITSVAVTSDGGYIVGGYFSDDITVGDYTLSNAGSSDGMIIKFEKKELNNPVTLQAQSIGGSGSDYINSVSGTSDGGYIVGGYFLSSSITVGNDVNGNPVELTNVDGYDGMIIKYDENGIVEWAQSIGGSNSDKINSVVETSDGGYIVGGDFDYYDITVGNDANGNPVELTNAGNSDGMIIKYDENGIVEWAQSIGGSNDDIITSIAGTSDGGYIVGGYFYYDITVGNDENGNPVVLTNAGSHDGMIIKYDENWYVEWAQSIGGSNSDKINSVAGTSDGGYIVGGYFEDDITVGNDANGNPVELTWTGSYYSDGMIIKYASDGVVEWAQSIGGSDVDQINSVAETSDGGYIVGGYFGYDDITIGNDVNGNPVELTNAGSYDGIIIKYDENGIVEWAQSIGGSNLEYINSVTGTSDGGYIVGGNFASSSITVGNYMLSNAGNSDGMIIKYDENGIVEWLKSIGGSSNDYINSVAETSNGMYIAGGYFNSSTIETDGKTLTNAGNEDGMILKIANQVGVPEVQELVVENTIKQFKITTDVVEIDGEKGGSISGENNTPYETVEYNQNSTKEIKITPDEGYEIINITVNGAEYPLPENTGSEYTFPVFTNVKENIHIEVTFAQSTQKINILKRDGNTKTPLEGVTFKLDQIEERTEPVDVIGNVTPNGATYADVDTENEVTSEVLGELATNSEYYFVQNTDGTLTPTNSKTYQLANNGTAGIGNTTANSYIPINLEGKTGNYIVVVNASISSQRYNDYGYATINTSATTIPTYSSSTGRFVYIHGTQEAKDYPSQALAGGSTYYLHLGYRKSASTDTGDDQIVIHSIKVYQAKDVTYTFVNNNGVYESNNQGRDNTVANAYIPIDLSNLTGKYNVIVNASISSASGDYGYATITNGDVVTAPSASTSTNRLVYITGTQEAKDYSIVLQGGQTYNLHLGYSKNASGSSGDDKFTINSVKITLNDSELYHTEVTTNSQGQAMTQIPYGRYQVTEVNAPEGYEPLSSPIIIDFKDGNKAIIDNPNTANTVTVEGENYVIENNETAKLVVRHYLKVDGEPTTTEVAPQENYTGLNGENYTTSPKTDLAKYELEKDSSGNYVLPPNSTGTYTPGTTYVDYYYVEKEIPLIVHHYISGTENPVPLKDGQSAEDENYSGKEGTAYTTNPIADENLSDEYELESTPKNATGTYEGEEIVVTYYYTKVKRQLVIQKYAEDGTTPLEGVQFSIQTNEGGQIGTYTTNSQGQIEVELEAGEYVAVETAVPETYKLPENPNTIFNITKQTNPQTLEITNSKKQGTVITHHYIENTTTRVPSAQGGEVADETQTGNVGDIYATKESTNIAENVEYTGNVVGNTSGEYTEGTTEVIYYYRYKEPSIVTPSITKESTITKVTSPEQAMNYTINYQATIQDYIGNATVTIVDQLPYEIDESKANNIAETGGVYSRENKTITWTINVENINSYISANNVVNITKEINFVYQNVDTSDTVVENTVTGTINLTTPEKEETVTTTKEIPAEYLTDITVTKVWDDEENVAQKRPESVYLVIKEGVVEKGRALVNAENNWTCVFEDLPKYDIAGDEINYTITEEEVNADDLKFYAEGVQAGSIDQGFTLTNQFEVPDETVNVTVNKVWNDTAKQQDKRPENITIVLNGGEKQYSKTIETTSNTVVTFEKLPKYNSQGGIINYTVQETGNNEFYPIGTVTGTMLSGYTITNTFTRPETTIDVTVTKAWEDTAEQQDKRPTEVTAVISGNGKTERYNVKAEENWTHTFEGLPKYDSNGDEIVYSVTEEGEYEFYTLKEVTGDQETGFTITNQFVLPGDTVNVTVTKAWEDTAEQQDKRPEQVTVVVSGNGKTERYNVKAEENWTHTFEGLPKYDSNGNEIVYTVTEEENSDFYELKEITGDQTSGFTITNKFVRPEDTIEVIVIKAWEDTQAQQDKRPPEVTVVVSGNGRTERYNVKAEEGWTHTFEGLPKYDSNGDEIVYTVTEEGEYEFYTLKEVTGDQETGFTITNQFVLPGDTVNVTVTKAWEDTQEQQDKRPEEVTVVVSGNGKTERYNVKAEENWTHTFEGLPKYDSNGNEIVYTVTEEGSYEFYTLKEVTGDQTSGFTITNQFVLPGDTVNVTVTKAWEDTQEQQDKRPEEVTAVISGNGRTERYNVKAEENWTYTFTGLPKYDSNGDEIVYTVTEEGSYEFYTLKEITGDQVNGFTITNEFVLPGDTVNVTVTKAWEDTQEQQDKRPEEVTVVVSGNGKTERYNVKASENWTHTFTGLPKYDSNGDEIVYTVTEEGSYKFYTLKEITGDQTSGFTITNQFVLPGDTVNVTVTKAWEDTAEQQDKRPELITAVITGGEITQKQDVKASENWTHTFEGLPKYDSNGNEIVYTLTEEENSDFYQLKEITGDQTSGFTITNKFVRPEDTIEVTVTKAWEDTAEQQDKRPQEVTVSLTGTLETENDIVRPETIRAEEGWTKTITNLPKYDVNGNEIEYTLAEERVNDFYELKEIAGDQVNGFTITNKFISPDDTIDVTVAKAWEDTQEQQDKRPEEVTVVISGNGKTERYNVKAEENWTHTFEGLPKYDSNGNEIVYTVTEEGSYDFYELKEITGDVKTGFTITNKFVKPEDTIEITVNKEWVDKDDIYEKRPDYLILKVINTSTQEETKSLPIKITGEDSYTFTNLAKYDENGDEIIYTAGEQEVSSGDLYNYGIEVSEITNIEGETDKKEITITNTIEKIPGTVVIRYVDINDPSKKDISTPVVKEGVVGESFDVSGDKKEIPEYTYIKGPEDPTGTYTEEEQERIYYYAKNTKVITKHLEQGTGIVLTEEPEYVEEGYVGKHYTTSKQEIEGYTYVADTGNLSGSMREEPITVIYYYAKNTKVISKYLEQGTNKVLTEKPEYVEEGYEGKDYKTEQKEIEGYTFVLVDGETEGKMTKEPITVTYYYAKNTKVISKYLEQGTNKVLTEEAEYVEEGYVGKDYKTEQKEIEGYTFVLVDGIEEGKMTEEPITVTYYYAKNTKVTVLHIDKNTNEILKEEEIIGKEGDPYETKPGNFEGYVLEESPENPNGNMTKEEIILKYYYVHKSAGVIEKHIDIITGELLENAIHHEGNENDYYNILSKTFENYDLVEKDKEGNNMLPENAEGHMKKNELIEVIYYYHRRASVRVEYINKLTGEKLTKEDEIIQGHQDDEYETKAKEFDDYVLEKMPENYKGKMEVTKNEDGTYNTETLVQYYYIPVAGGVKEEHIDIHSNKIIITETHQGKIGDKYEIPSREIEGYKLVEEDEEGNSMLPTNAIGEMEEDLITVKYYYEKEARVIVKYVDKETGEELYKEEIKGYEGDPYETERKEFDGYDLIEEPKNKEGKMEEKDITVIYYYAKKTEIEVQYLEKGTNNPLAENEIIKGHVGEEYKTEAKEIAYYKFVESTKNTEGKMKEEKIIVKYYYEKQVFNLKVDKWIGNVIMDGIPQASQSIGNNEQLIKVEMHRNKVETADIKIIYKIRISNVGEIEGNVNTITDVIPEGYVFHQEDNEITWEETQGILTTKDLEGEVINPGEYKEIEMVLRWEKGEENFGEKTNLVLLSQISNPAGYEDINKEDNSSKTSMILTVATGLDKNDKIVVVAVIQIVLVTVFGLLLSYKKRRK